MLPSTFTIVLAPIQAHRNMTLTSALQRFACAVSVLSALPTTGAEREVTLPGYGSFTGTSINQTLTKKPLPAPVDAWLGIDYAAQPIGDRRFAQPGPPSKFLGSKNAIQYGYSCLQDPAELPYEQNEACLSMNVFRPQNATSQKNLPVLIWIHGVSCFCLRTDELQS